jgi:hypothetical protein
LYMSVYFDTISGLSERIVNMMCYVFVSATHHYAHFYKYAAMHASLVYNVILSFIVFKKIVLLSVRNVHFNY